MQFGIARIIAYCSVSHLCSPGDHSLIESHSMQINFFDFLNLRIIETYLMRKFVLILS